MIDSLGVPLAAAQRLRPPGAIPEKPKLQKEPLKVNRNIKEDT